MTSCLCLFSLPTVDGETLSPSQQRSNAVDRQCERQQLKSNQDVVFLIPFINFFIVFFMSGQMESEISLTQKQEEET